MTSTQDYEARSREDAEMWCDRCKRRHGVVWAAPSDLWNLVMREGDRGKPDEVNFCCPICFMQLADERGVGNFMWDVRMWEPAPEATGTTHSARRRSRPNRGSVTSSLLADRYRAALEKIATPLSEPQWCPCGGRFTDSSDEAGLRCADCRRHLTGFEHFRIALDALGK